VNVLAAAQIDVENHGNDVGGGFTRQLGAVSLSLRVSIEGLARAFAQKGYPMGIRSLRSILVAGITAGIAVAVLPAAAATTAAVTVGNTSAHVISHTKNASTSTNWSGYAKTGTFTAATGTWTVPTVSGSGSHYSSQWVGIDGFNNSNLIQTGTEADVVGGRASYAAWWEILPAAETRISLTVHAGDSITGSVSKTSGTTWKITLTDNTSGASFTTSKTYRGSGTSAEWIEEATQVNGNIGTPPQFSTFSFSGLTANGASPGLVSSQEILLVQNGVTYSTPSSPNSGGNGFSVSYTG
jgi:Peptidase A4 family